MRGNKRMQGVKVSEPGAGARAGPAGPTPDPRDVSISSVEDARVLAEADAIAEDARRVAAFAAEQVGAPWHFSADFIKIPSTQQR